MVGGLRSQWGKAQSKAVKRVLLAVVGSVGVMISTASAWAGDRPDAAGTDSDVAATASESKLAPATQGTLLPQFSGSSGDFSLSRQPTIGALHRDEKGYLEPGFYVDAMSNHRSVPTPPERVRLGETETVRTWDVGAIIGYQLSDNADPRTGAGINLQLVTGGPDFESGMLLQPGFDYTVPFSDSLQLSARVFTTYAPQAGNRAAAAQPEATSPTLRSLDTEGGWRDVGVNLGVGYSVSERWTLETQAGYTQSLAERTKTPGSKDEQQPRGEIFGGVFLNYRF